MSEEYLTVTEAAEKLSVSPRTIQRYCKQGRLNYKWVTGKRHRELRIIPPIPVSDLPGVRQKKGIDADFVTIEDFQISADELRHQLMEKDRRIDELIEEIEHLKNSLTEKTSIRGMLHTESHDTDILDKARELVRDYNEVRPVEKKLILKMAKELKAHTEFLRSLGMSNTES